MKNKNYQILYKALAVVFALAVWQIAASTIHESILLVGPFQVIKRLCTIWREEQFFSSLAYTFVHISEGFLLGLATGVVLAVLAYKLPFVEILLWPWMLTVKAVPVASFVVICLIWLSSRNLSIFISFLIVLPLIYHNIYEGLKKQDKNLKEMAKIYDMGFINRVKFIVFPTVAPFLYSACRIACGVAWKAGVAAEIIGTPPGSIGRMLYLSKIYLDTDDLLAWTVIIVILSVLSEKIFMKLLGLILRVEAK